MDSAAFPDQLTSKFLADTLIYREVRDGKIVVAPFKVRFERNLGHRISIGIILSRRQVSSKG